ncbi:hypothetical protein GGI35DRAFT_49679 [Trichoderma velutinum]
MPTNDLETILVCRRCKNVLGLSLLVVWVSQSFSKLPTEILDQHRYTADLERMCLCFIVAIYSTPCLSVKMAYSCIDC